MKIKFLFIMLIGIMFYGCASDNGSAAQEESGNETVEVTDSPAAVVEVAPVITLDGLNYSNNQAGFSVEFPEGWALWNKVEDMPETYASAFNQIVAGGLDVYYMGEKEGKFAARATGEKAGYTTKAYCEAILSTLDENFSVVSKEYETDEDGNVFGVAAFVDSSTGMAYMDVYLTSGVTNIRLTFWSATTDFEALANDVSAVLDSGEFL